MPFLCSLSSAVLACSGVMGNSSTFGLIPCAAAIDSIALTSPPLPIYYQHVNIVSESRETYACEWCASSICTLNCARQTLHTCNDWQIDSAIVNAVACCVVGIRWVWGCYNVSSSFPFCDASLSTHARVADLISHMSLSEKMYFLGADTTYTNVNK